MDRVGLSGDILIVDRSRWRSVYAIKGDGCLEFGERLKVTIVVRGIRVLGLTSGIYFSSFLTPVCKSVASMSRRGRACILGTLLLYFVSFPDVGGSRIENKE